MKHGLLGWGRYPQTPQASRRVAWQVEIADAIRSTAHPTLAHGNGRSYGDSCLAASGTVVHMNRLTRVIAADWTSGVLRAEAGITLGEILELSVPKGWFLPVTPGTKFVTLGGAVANDVHGKNHHRAGTFGRHVRAFELHRSDMESRLCSPALNTELFNATIGGLGLTGIMSWIELQLVPINGPSVDTVTVRFGSLEAFFDLAARFDESHDYGVAWVDCLASGRNLGRGIYIAARHASGDGPTHPPSKRFRVPFTPPVPVVNGVTTRLFNPLHWHMAPARETSRTMHFDPYFYPLDGIHEWNRLYGNNGFQQFQCVIPEEQSEAGISSVLKTVARSGLASFLTVLKRCSDIPSPGILSFPMKGVTLAIDFAQSARLANGLLPELDRIVHEHGGRLYPAKDAHMSARDFQSAYPAWKQVETLRDPALNSAFWKRVTA